MHDLKLGFRELWKNPGFTAVAVLALAASTVARAEEETEHFDRTLAFPSGGTLQLHNFSSDVHITGTTGNDLVIRAVRRARRPRPRQHTEIYDFQRRRTSQEVARLCN